MSASTARSALRPVSFVSFALLLCVGSVALACGGRVIPAEEATDGGIDAGASDVDHDSAVSDARVDVPPADAPASPVHADGYARCDPPTPFTQPSAPCIEADEELGGLCASPGVVDCRSLADACTGDPTNAAYPLLENVLHDCAGGYDGGAISAGFDAEGCATTVWWQDMPHDVAQCFVDFVVGRRFSCAASSGLTAAGICGPIP